MDIKQLVTGNPKAGFYPVTQDTITVIELNKAVMNLTNESSSEDIIAAFDNLESFQALIAEVRNPQNICSGILINETPEDKRVGKYEASIIANTDAETLHVRWIENDKIVALTITNTDGTMSCIRNENNVGGDKTNVLILSLENDLANGQKNSPVDAEVSTALKDAISTGKACVIKSANSDILANLQQISDNVIIVMEQISRIGQTFVAVNTTITVNTVTNVISDYQTGALVLETEGDGSKFLSNNGEYKEIPQANLSNYLAKDNTTPFTPDADYEPATKKYVDDKNIEIPLIDINDYYQNKELTIPQTFLNEIINRIDNKEIIPGKFCAIQFQHNTDDYMYAYSVTYHFTKELVYINAFNRNTPEYGTGHTSGNGFVEIILAVNRPIKLKYSGDVSERILTESEYTALGEAVNNDDILYFVTPDA